LTTTSNEPVRLFNLSDVIKILEDSIVANLRLFVTVPRQNDANAVGNFLNMVKTNMRFYSMNARDLEVFWNDIREDEEFMPTQRMEFMLDVTMDFIARYLSTEGLISPTGDVNNTWENLLQTLAIALASPRNALSNVKPTDLVVTDEEFRSRGLTQNEWVEFMDNNRWVIFLVLWKFSHEDAASLMLKAGFRMVDPKRVQNASTPASGA